MQFQSRMPARNLRWNDQVNLSWKDIGQLVECQRGFVRKHTLPIDLQCRHKEVGMRRFRKLREAIDTVSNPQKASRFGMMPKKRARESDLLCLPRAKEAALALRKAIKCGMVGKSLFGSHMSK